MSLDWVQKLAQYHFPHIGLVKWTQDLSRFKVKRLRLKILQWEEFVAVL